MNGEEATEIKGEMCWGDSEIKSFFDPIQAPVFAVKKIYEFSGYALRKPG
jgi:hypothetical protein